MLNRVILIGRLTRDPELSYIPSGDAVVKFTLAVDRNYTNKQGERDTDFIPILAWRKLGEVVSKYTVKGSLVAVDGRLQVRTYEKDGQRRYVTEVVAENVRFLDYRKSQEQEQYDGYQGTEVSDDDVPF